MRPHGSLLSNLIITQLFIPFQRVSVNFNLERTKLAEKSKCSASSECCSGLQAGHHSSLSTSSRLVALLKFVYVYIGLEKFCSHCLFVSRSVIFSLTSAPPSTPPPAAQNLPLVSRLAFLILFLFIWHGAAIVAIWPAYVIILSIFCQRMLYPNVRWLHKEE